MKHAAHRTERPPRRRGRIAVATAALLGAVVVLMGGQGTFAFWTDRATVASGDFSSGRLDLTVDGQQGNPSFYMKTDLKMDRMLPGESVARIVTVANAGDVPLTWVPAVSKDGGLGPALTVELTLGASVTATNTDVYPRRGTCSGGTPIASPASSPVLAKGESRLLCVKVTLPSTTGDAFQGVSGGSVTIGLNASQVVVP